MSRNTPTYRRLDRRHFLGGAALGAAGLGLAACGDDGNGDAEPTPEATDEATTVGISLNEWTITAEGGGAPPTVPAGEVSFEVHNAGQIPHELVIIKTDTDPAQFPVSGGKVDEEAVGELIGEVEEFPAGETETGTFGLQPGTYALICNIAAHHEQGMHAQLVVE
jgi:uncharacterized cupredoxin-like copper-binding protein